LSWTILVTIIDQFIHQNITVALIGFLLIATTIILSIKERIAVFSFILFFFFFGIFFLDIEQTIKIGNLTNGVVFIFFAFIISNLINSFSKSCLIRDQNKLLENYNSELKQFAYIASHDLKAPLRTINSFIGLLDRTMPEKTSQQYEFMKFIQDGSSNMSTLIDDLLAFTTLEKEANMEILELSDILLVVKSNLSAEITANEAIIKHPEMPQVKGIKPHLILLFQNLIGNALKYRSKASPIIDISYFDDGDQIKFEIKDNGIGVPLVMKEQIFNLFSRGDHSKQEFKGTGLGLAICEKIINQLNGTIWVDSNGEDGSSFYFTIPVLT
jgi:light-regulated signal transduction histidine kinase (bacteriophytochrome)